MDNFTFNEIHQQPAMWRKELQALLAAKAEISAFMHKYLTPDTDIVLTGAGTSAFIGDALLPVMRGMWQNVRSVPTTDLITHSEYLLSKERPLLLVSFARSGNSPESVGAVNLANKLCKNVAHVYITCNKNGKLAQQAAGLVSQLLQGGAQLAVLLQQLFTVWVQFHLLSHLCMAVYTNSKILLKPVMVKMARTLSLMPLI